MPELSQLPYLTTLHLNNNNFWGKLRKRTGGCPWIPKVADNLNLLDCLRLVSGPARQQGAELLQTSPYQARVTHYPCMHTHLACAGGTEPQLCMPLCCRPTATCLEQPGAHAHPVPE
jgi:hypothetical protein